MLKMMTITDLLIKIIADYIVIAVVALGAWAMLLRVSRQFRYEAIARGVICGLSALLAAKIASLFYQGVRPFMASGSAPKAAYLNNPGFPSDHVLFVCVIALVAWASTKDKKLGIALGLLCALVALGRVAALVHTPADVAGGAACALLAAFIVYGRQLFTTKELSN